MKKIILILGLLACNCEVDAQRIEIYPIVPGGASGGAAAGVTSIAAGSDIVNTLSNAPNNSAYQLGVGTYTVTPSIAGIGQAPGIGGGAGFTRAINLFNKTNISILGVPGRTIIDGGLAFDSTNNLGEILLATNCLNLYLYGITFRGQFLTNFTLWTNATLWAGIGLFNCKNVTIENCNVIDHFDQGIWDVAALSAVGPHCTNVNIINGLIQNIGSQRTNLGPSQPGDGAGIVPTGWRIENVTFRDNWRHIEPFDEIDGYPFNSLVIKGCYFEGSIDSGIYTAGSTNCHNALVTGNRIFQPRDYTRRGTNQYQTASAIHFNAGQAPNIRDNVIEGYVAGVNLATATDMYGAQIVNNTFRYQSNAAVASYALYIGDLAVTAPRIKQAYIANNLIQGSQWFAMYVFGLADSVVENNLFREPITTGGFECVNLAGNAGANTNILFMGNSIIDVGTLDIDAGFAINSGQYIRFVNNDVQGTTMLYSNLVGAEVVIRQPPTIVSATLVSGTYTNTQRDTRIRIPNGSTRTNKLNIPFNGHQVTVEDNGMTASGTNIWVVATTGVINNGPSLTNIANNGGSITLEGDGTNWRIISRFP